MLAYTYSRRSGGRNDEDVGEKRVTGVTGDTSARNRTDAVRRVIIGDNTPLIFHLYNLVPLSLCDLKCPKHSATRSTRSQ